MFIRRLIKASKSEHPVDKLLVRVSIILIAGTIINIIILVVGGIGIYQSFEKINKGNHYYQTDLGDK